MRAIDVLPQEAAAIQSPAGPFQWIMARRILSLAQDTADHFCETVVIKSRDGVVRRVDTKFTRSPANVRSISEEKIRQIRGLLGRGLPCAKVAEVAGVSDRTVRAIRSGDRYRGVGVLEET